MSLPDGFLDELRARVPISRVIGRKVVWDQRKSNQARGDWWAPCPFHQEKTASFHCDDQKGFYYCFGCHAKGDALTFLRESEGMEFMDAVRWMASEAGMSLPERDPTAARRADRRSELVEAMEAATRHYRLQLATSAGASARDYLAGRGLDAAALDRFEIGFAPDGRQHLLGALREKGLAEDLIIEAGLAARPDGGGTPYDRFRSRIIFPIRDGRGRAIAFGGRAMDPNARAKYLNSPETPLFDKGRNLYNLAPARAAVSKGAPLLVAEGYMDVIALVLAGFEGAVAPLGTAITEEQLRLMWRISPEPIIMLDGDAAGQRAAMRLVDLALPMTGPGQALRFVTLPEGRDPDDLLREGGAAAMQALIAQARPLVDLLWTRETEGRDFDSPERRAALDKALREAIARIPDDSTRSHYAAEIKDKRWQLFGGRRGAGRITPSRGETRKWGAPPGALAQTKASAFVAGDAGDGLLEAVVLAICARHPALIEGIEYRLERFDCADPGRAALCHDLLTGGDSQAGRAALTRLQADPTVQASLRVTRTGDEAQITAILTNALDKLDARRAAIAETARAEAEIDGLADEGLTWRIQQSARARHHADHPEMEDTSDLGEDRDSMSALLRAALEGRVWERAGKGPALPPPQQGAERDDGDPGRTDLGPEAQDRGPPFSDDSDAAPRITSPDSDALDDDFA